MKLAVAIIFLFCLSAAHGGVGNFVKSLWGSVTGKNNQPCPVPICPQKCPLGQKSDNNGCPICDCISAADTTTTTTTTTTVNPRAPTYNCATNNPCMKTGSNEYYRHDNIKYFIQCSYDAACYEVDCPPEENCDDVISTASKYA